MDRRRRQKKAGMKTAILSARDIEDMFNVSERCGSTTKKQISTYMLGDGKGIRKISRISDRWEESKFDIYG
jgi:hypothetical protein